MKAVHVGSREVKVAFNFISERTVLFYIFQEKAYESILVFKYDKRVKPLSINFLCTWKYISYRGTKLAFILF
jgi:hypothetical protein